MKAEHDAIHQRLVRATAAPGRTADAARALAEVLHPHFAREEQVALPPLGLLAPLARGEFTPEMARALSMTDSLRAELPRMLEEHKEVHDAAARLAELARIESNTLRMSPGPWPRTPKPRSSSSIPPRRWGEIVRTRAAAHGR